jgi:hypothetical protein
VCFGRFGGFQCVSAGMYISAGILFWVFIFIFFSLFWVSFDLSASRLLFPLSFDLSTSLPPAATSSFKPSTTSQPPPAPPHLRPARLQLLPRCLRPIPHLPNCFSKFTSMVEASSFIVHPQQWSLVMGLWSLDMEFKEERNFRG